MLSRISRKIRHAATDPLAGILGDDSQVPEQTSEPATESAPVAEFNWEREFRGIQGSIDTSEDNPQKAGEYDIWIKTVNGRVVAGAKKSGKLVFQFDSSQGFKVSKDLKSDESFKALIAYLKQLAPKSNSKPKHRLFK